MAKKSKKAAAAPKESAFSEIMRKFKANPFLYIGSVLILIIISVTFLAGDLLSGRSRGSDDLTFGYYDKVPISWVPGNYFSQYYNQLIQYYRDYIDPNDFQFGATIWRQAFEAATVHTAILQEMKKSNYNVPARTVDRQVAQLPHFQENGRFSTTLYRRMSETDRLALWRQIQDDLTKGLYYNDLFSLQIPAGEADFFGAMSSDMRNFDIVSFLVDDYPASEYLFFAYNNSDLFRTIHLSMISINSEREAKRIRDSILNETTSFEEAARSQSQDGYADRGGDMGIRYIYDLDWEIPNADSRQKIISLTRGEISDVVQLGTMWGFFRIEDELKEANFEDEAVMDRVRSHVRNFERGRMEDWAITQAQDFISEVKEYGFNDLVQMRGMEKHSIGPISINYGNVDLFTSLDSFSIPVLSSTELSDMSRNDNFWKAAFSTQINTVSEPFVQGSKVLVLFPLELSSPQEQQLDSEFNITYEDTWENFDYISQDINNDRSEEISSMYSSYWANYVTEQSLQLYFLNSEKMDNRFWDTFYNFSSRGYY